MMSSYPSRESDVRHAKYAPSQAVQSITTAYRWSSSSGALRRGVFTDAATAATVPLILLIFGTGLGLPVTPPWASKTISTQAFVVSAIIWITATQLLASGMKGYLIGRLRPKWESVSNDKIHFRDTTHGFLAWAVAVVPRFELHYRRFAKPNRVIG